MAVSGVWPGLGLFGWDEEGGLGFAAEVWSTMASVVFMPSGVMWVMVMFLRSASLTLMARTGVVLVGVKSASFLPPMVPNQRPSVMGVRLPSVLRR